MKRQIRIMIPILLSCVLAGLLVGLIRWMEIEDIMIYLLHRADSAGFGGQLLIVALGAISVMAILPSVLLTLAAGFLYGALYGSVLIVVGETIGALIAFAITRTGIVQKWTERLRQSSSLKVVNLIMQTSGWELVAAIRMIPFFPFKLSNYLFGLSPVRLKHYLIGTLIGLWPITLFNTYLGSLAGDLMSLGIPERERSLTEWTVVVAGFIAVLIFMVYAVSRAQRMLRKHESNRNTDNLI